MLVRLVSLPGLGWLLSPVLRCLLAVARLRERLNLARGEMKVQVEVSSLFPEGGARALTMREPPIELALMARFR